MKSASKYFKREGQPSTEEIVEAIRDIEDRLNENPEPLAPYMRQQEGELEGLKDDISVLLNETEKAIKNLEALLDRSDELTEKKDGKSKL